MKTINCLIVDDEPIARKGIVEHVLQIELLNIIADCKNAIEAVNMLQSHEIDLMFLDIQMPKVTGIEFMKNLRNPPLTIITTAYPEYAIDGYELDVVDYLLKPVSFSRFSKAVDKAKEIIENRSQNKTDIHDFFFIKSNQKIEKVIVNEIAYVESLSNYVIIHTTDKKIVSYLTFKSVEKQLPSNKFLRIHRGFLVAMEAIKSIDGNALILQNGAVLPIGKSYKDEVMEVIERFLFKR